MLFMFAWITWFCSALLIDAYRYPDTEGDKRNYNYIQAVKRYLGEALSLSWLDAAFLCLETIARGHYRLGIVLDK